MVFFENGTGPTFEILIFYESPQQRSVKLRFSGLTLSRESAGQIFCKLSGLVIKFMRALPGQKMQRLNKIFSVLDSSLENPYICQRFKATKNSESHSLSQLLEEKSLMLQLPESIPGNKQFNLGTSCGFQGQFLETKFHTNS